HAIVTVPCFPIDIRQCRPVSVGATRPLLRMQAFEPAFEWRIGIAAIQIPGRSAVSCCYLTAESDKKNQRHKKYTVSPISLGVLRRCHCVRTSSRSSQWG